MVNSPTHALRSVAQSHVHYRVPFRILTVPVSVAITKFSSLGELLVAFLDCMVAHIDAVEAAHVLHCDVSLPNLLLSSQNGRRSNHLKFMESLGAQQKEYLSKRIGSLARRGVLADWGCAVPIAPSPPPAPVIVGNSERQPSAGYVAASVATPPSRATVNNSEIVDSPVDDATPPTEPADIPGPNTKSANRVTVMGKGLPDSARELIPILKLSAFDEIVVLAGGSNPEDDRRCTTDGGPLYRTGTWSWMSAALIMADPGRPVIRESHHDLESFFYILVSICVLLDEPFKYKSDDEPSWSFHECFSISEPSAFKTATTQSNLGWFSIILPNILPYFKPLIPLLNHLRKEIILPLNADKDGTVCRDKPLMHQGLIEAIVMALHDLPDDAWKPYQDPNADCPGNEANDSGESVWESAKRSTQEEERMLQTKESAVSLPVEFVTGDSEDHHQRRSTLDVHNSSSMPIDDPPTLPGISTGFRIVGTYVKRVRKRTRDDASDNYSLPRVKRARSSSRTS